MVKRTHIRKVPSICERNCFGILFAKSGFRRSASLSESEKVLREEGGLSAYALNDPERRNSVTHLCILSSLPNWYDGSRPPPTLSVTSDHSAIMTRSFVALAR